MKDKTVREIVKARTRRMALLGERREIEGAPLPADEAERHVGAYVERLARRWQREVPLHLFTAPADDTRRGQLFDSAVPLRFASVAGGAVDLAPVAHMLAAVAPELLRGALLEAVGRSYGKSPPGLPAAERAAALAEIDRELREVELGEERLIRALEAEGLEIDRRADANPALVLARVA